MSETMSETDTTEGEEEAETIQSSKTVVVSEEVHMALRYIAADEEASIKSIVDRELRKSDAIQDELELLRKMGKLDEIEEE